jgi:asparagine synthase (glutamine-hydrolysing)
VEGDPYLPKEVLWRQKEQFSDGVGYSWIDGLKAHAEKIVSDEQLRQACNRCAAWDVKAMTCSPN